MFLSLKDFLKTIFLLPIKTEDKNTICFKKKLGFILHKQIISETLATKVGNLDMAKSTEIHY